MSKPKTPTLADVEALRRAGQHARAEEMARAVFAASPGEPRALRVLVELLLARGDLAAAEQVCRTALAAGRLAFEAHQLLCAVLTRRGQRDDAVLHGRAALALRPDDALTLRNLGGLLRSGVELDEAIALLERAARLAPDDAGVHAHLGSALSAAGEHARAIRHLERSLVIAPRDLDTHSALLGALHYASEVDAARIAEAHRRCGRLLEGGVTRLPPRRPREDANRRLRIGYVSADFRLHSVAFFFEPLLAYHDRTRVELFAYSQTTHPDGVTQRLLTQLDAWRDLVGMSDDEAAARIRADAIDVLVDLSGHTRGNRLGVFARRPAPVQMTYLGYPDTTGLTTIDVRITDAEADPPGMTESLHSERLVRLPHGFLCYRPPEGAPPVAPAPSTLGHIPTFASFNALTKLSAETLTLWARLLRETPEARLLLKHVTLTTPEGRARYAERLAAHGLPLERVVLRGFVPGLAAHLDAYAEVDVALDPFPYHGTTTTCDALYMGVPVVSLLGAAHVSRVGASLLARAGLRELAVDGADAYAETARALLRDEARRVAIRATMRDRIFAGGLTDPERFARSFERALLDAVDAAAGSAPTDAPRASDDVETTFPALADTVWRVSQDGLRIASPADDAHPVSRLLRVRAEVDVSTRLSCSVVGAEGVALDVDAGHGLVALPLARAAGQGGAVCAFVAESAFAARLRASAQVNGLDGLAVRSFDLTSLAADVEAALAGREGIALVRLGPNAAVPAVVAALGPLLARDAPLVTLPCDARGVPASSLVAALAARGAMLHRLVPQLGVLVPVRDDEPAMPGTATLFAVLPACAERLAARGLCVVPAAEAPALPEGASFAAAVPPALLARFPVLSRAFDAGTPGQRAHRAALASFALARDGSRPLDARVASLREALRHALRALDDPHELSRFFTVARVADAWGQPALAVEALTTALAVVVTPRARLSEPFAVPAPRFDALDPGARLRDWAVAAAVERLEQLSGPEGPAPLPDSAALGRLETFAQLGFLSPEMARRLALRRADAAHSPV
jgi:protein O-GlcNAc transferase